MENINNGYLAQHKIFAHPERLTEWITKGITKPIMIEIDPTNECNYNCSYCAGNRSTKQAKLNIKFMKNIINQIAPFCKGLVFTGGGEPLMNKDTIKAVKYAKSKNINVGFITNGSLITKKNAKILLESCTWIRISINGIDKEEFTSNHRIGKENFQKVLNNIKLLVKTKKKLKSKCTIGLGYLTNKNNKENVLKFAKLAKRLGVNYAQFRPYHYTNTNVDKELIKCKKLENNYFKIISTQHRYHKEEGSFKQCFRDEFTTIISADGKMYPCCFTRGIVDFEIGDLNKQTFENIWTSKKRKKVNKNKLTNPKCPIMGKYDTLNKLLWDIYILNKEKVHLNFI